MTASTRLYRILTENDDIDYTYAGSTKAKTAAGDYSKVTATVAGKKSERFTKLAKKFAEIDSLNKKITELRNEANDEAKKHIEELFKAEDAAYTRYIDTRSLVITMSKDQGETETTTKSVDYDGFLSDLYELVDDDLQPVIEKLLEAHTKTATKVRAAQKGRVSVKVKESEKLEESFFGKLKSFVSNVYRSTVRRLSSYDRSLAKLKKRYGVA